MLKKLPYFFGLFAYGMCTIASVFSAIDSKDWFAALCAAGLSAMAFPLAKKWFKVFQEE